ncbi:MAG: sigma-E processing peptidase SpoIIGA [Bacillota bacterium]
MRVYGDVYLLTNFLVDLALLWAAATLARHPARPWRLALGAAVGAAYSLWVLLAGRGPFGGLPGLLVAAAAMLAASFVPTTPSAFFALYGYFLSAAVFLGGAVLVADLAASSLRPDYALGPSEARWWAVAAGLAAVLTAGRAAWGSFRRRAREAGRLIGLSVEVDGRPTDLTALVDTGNQLRDPLSGHPVVVVELTAIAPLLPAELIDVYRVGPAAGLDGGFIGSLSGLDRLPEPWLARVRIVPFTSLGKENGLLLGFRPDGLTVRGPGGPARRRDAVVCVYAGTMSEDGSYSALLHPDLAPPTAKGV